MKKIAILSKTVCPSTQKLIQYFTQQNYDIDCVIIEKRFRRKFSKTERKYRHAHDKFNKKTRKYPFVRRMARRLWDITPVAVKKIVFINIYSIPLLSKFSMRRFCEANHIAAFEVSKHSSPETQNILKERDIAFVLMGSSNWLLKEPIISMPDTKIINAHSGWLPKHKGLDSIGWSIKTGDPVGITTHFIDEGVDSGNILKFYEAAIEPGNTFNSITKKIWNMRPGAYYDTLQGLENRTIQPARQDDEIPPHTPMSYEELCEINSKLIAANTGNQG